LPRFFDITKARVKFIAMLIPRTAATSQPA
jgi:hypothetical protein